MTKIQELKNEIAELYIVLNNPQMPDSAKNNMK